MNSVVWQNNINLFVNMLLYAKSPDFNHDIVDKRKLINEGKYDNLKWYNELYLDQVLEFCDLTFNSNEDKIYFLRQYLKSFEIGESDFKKCKQFVKKG